MKQIDRFILREILSDGAAGTVYKADEELPGDNHRTVALKVLPVIGTADKARAERFYAEVKVLAQLSVQPHVVTIYAMGVSEGYPWLAMEYVEQTAASKVGEEQAEPAEVLKLIQQVSRGLLAMHQLDPPLIHQDLKPANILLDARGNYKVTDFSLSTVISANRTHGLATVRYAAPELLSSEFGSVGPATDLYSLGHIAYEMALGSRQHRHQLKAVFEGNASKEPPANKWMMWHASGNTRPAGVSEVRKDFPPELSQVIERLMAKPIAQRYASAEEVLADLSALRGSARATAPASAARAEPAANRHALPPPLPQEEPAEAAAAELSIAETPATPRVPMKAVPLPNSQKYWVRLRGKVTGPFDATTLQRQIRQGQLSRLHQVSVDQVIWKAASEVEALYGPTIV